MAYAKVTLFAVDAAGEISEGPVHAEASFKAELSGRLHDRVTITVADDAMGVAGTVVLPFSVLGQLVEAARNLRSRCQPGSVLPM